MPTDDILHMPFPKLTMFSFRRLLNVQNNEMDDFLILNPLEKWTNNLPEYRRQYLQVHCQLPCM